MADIYDSRIEQWLRLPCNEQERDYCKAAIDKGVKNLNQPCCLECFELTEQMHINRLVD
jgi:hypothetical protein